ncbi:MAG: DNA replication initiation control protein YabA [Firmicutes bacterium]|nr:DNA replication initiation control protein YabA [Bacillota bacterium]
MTLKDDLEQWRKKLNAVLDEGDALHERVADLEKENALLQERLMNGDKTDGFEAVTKIYDEGYHICPANFGRTRDEECLFCLNFLLHKGKKDV